jgi:hypothetical protein
MLRSRPTGVGVSVRVGVEVEVLVGSVVAVAVGVLGAVTWTVEVDDGRIVGVAVDRAQGVVP